MTMDDVIQIIMPEQDSHFRLLPCPKCKGDNVAYTQKEDLGGERWHVKCFDCGFEGQGAEARHEAQVIWNKMTNIGRC